MHCFISSLQDFMKERLEFNDPKLMDEAIQNL